jgi:hypothetical protein
MRQRRHLDWHAATQADALIGDAQVYFGQIVAIHQRHELFHSL